MKKTFILLIFAVTALISVSCGGNAKKAEAHSSSIYLTKADFLEKVANFETNSEQWKYLGDKPAIIDFYADWCSPCKEIAPLVDSLAAEYAGRIYVYKVDVDKEPVLANVFGIESIPTLLFIPMEGGPRVSNGVMPREDFVYGIEAILLGNIPEVGSETELEGVVE